MKYVDGFVIPVPKKNLQKYLRMARLGKKIWMEHGALAYFECVGDELESSFGLSFPKGIRAKRGETVIFAWIVYKSKAHRNRVNAKVMNDPRMNPPEVKDMPFDMQRMMYGGFKASVAQQAS